MKLYEILCPGGREGKMAEYIMNYGKALGFSVKRDNLGSVICEGKESGITFECGMDSVSFLISAIKADGTAKIALSRGGSAAASFVGKRVCLIGGAVGVLRCGKKDEISDSDLTLDIGASSKEEAQKRISIGEVGAVLSPIEEIGEMLCGSDASRMALLEIMLSLMKELPDISFVFSAQKSLGARGIKALSENYETGDFISLDTEEESEDFKMFNGVGVLIKDKGVPCRTSLCEELLALDDKAKPCISKESKATSVMDYAKGIERSGAVILPVRGKGTEKESVSLSDIAAAKELLRSFAKKLKQTETAEVNNGLR